jgi:predicted esterase
MKIKLIWIFFLLLQTAAGWADQTSSRFFDLVVSQTNKTLPVFEISVPAAKVNFVVLPGGAAGFGKVVEGRPGSQNALVRMQPLFATKEASTFAMFRPREMTQEEMSYDYRLTKDHMAEIGSVIRHIRQRSQAPIWLIGTSRGTVSATRAALVMPGEIDGIVLTASVVRRTVGNVSSQEIENIRRPVLMVHHVADACPVCPHDEAKTLLERFSAAPRKAFFSVSNGANPREGVCGPLHWHGFPGAEQEVVDRVMDWILAGHGATPNAHPKR